MESLEFRFAFHARDFERSISFYRDLMGLQPVQGWWDRPDGKGALFSAGGTGVIEIYGAADSKTYDGGSPEGMNLALRLPNDAAVDDFYGKLVTLGARMVEEPQDRAWGHRSFIVSDPDGIPIHIYCEL